MEISNRIQKIIEHYGYSPSEFADTIDVARSSISHITSGRNKASLDFIVKIKNRFPEIRWDWLIEGQGEMLAYESKQTNKEGNNNEQNIIEDDLFSNIPEYNHNPKTIEKVKSLDNITEKSDENPDAKPTVKQIVFFFENGKFEIFTP